DGLQGIDTAAARPGARRVHAALDPRRATPRFSTYVASRREQLVTSLIWNNSSAQRRVKRRHLMMEGADVDTRRLATTPRLRRSGSFRLWFPSILSGCGTVGCPRNFALVAAVYGCARVANAFQPARLARSRDALRLCCGGDHRISDDRDPQLDRPAACQRLAACRPRAPVDSRAGRCTDVERDRRSYRCSD